MSEQTFVTFCKNHVRDYYYGTLCQHIALEDIYVVWLCKTLQNNKALLSTALPDGLYFEITYNGDKQEAYIDVYKKAENYMVGV